MSQPSQTDILAALQAQTSSFSSRPTSSTSLITDHHDPESSLTTAHSSHPINKTRVYCWREGCGSLILLPGVGEWILAVSNIIPSEGKSPFPPSAAVASSSAEGESEKAMYWHIAGSPMAFENIGFSRQSTLSLPPDAPGVTAARGNVKFLICAECDLGPLGWSFEGGTEAWLAVERLRYGEPS